MSSIVFTKRSWSDYLYWQQRDIKIARKINALLKSIERDGALFGERKPEKLKYRPGDYSRRIDGENRLVYSVSGDEIVVRSCKGHYEE